MFKPLPFTVERSRNRQVFISTPAIDWATLDADQINIQWRHCTNALWSQEREGKITRDDLLPTFFEVLESIGFSKSEIGLVRKLKDWQVSFNLISIGFLLKNVYFREESKNFLIEKIKGYLNIPVVEEKVEESVKVVPKRTIKDSMAEQLSDIIGEIESMQDRLEGGFLKWFQQNNVPKVHCDAILAYYKPRHDELVEAQKNKDEQLREAYAHLNRKTIKSIIAWYEELFSDLDAYKRVKQAQRKVRKRKPVSPTKVVAKLNYMRYDDETKITSIKPETVLGKNTLWVYNSKTRKLCVYVASEIDKELTIKGSTILGWDAKLSVCKTLRKPNEQLKKFMEGGKVAMRNFFKSVRAKEGVLNGRINKDVLLLKVY